VVRRSHKSDAVLHPALHHANLSVPGGGRNHCRSWLACSAPAQRLPKGCPSGRAVQLAASGFRQGPDRFPAVCGSLISLAHASGV
jgi:hypothetical protein